MYLKAPGGGSEPKATPTLAFAIGLAVAATLLFGVYPDRLFALAEASARSLGAAALSAAIR
jgi:hypothetical protein